MSALDEGKVKQILNPKVTVEPVMPNQYRVCIDCTIAYREGRYGPIDMTTATKASVALQAEDTRSWARSAVDRLLVYDPGAQMSDEWAMLYLALQRLPPHLRRLVLKEARRRGRQLRQKLRLGERRWERAFDHRTDRARKWTEIRRSNDRTRSRLSIIGDILRNTDRYTRHVYFPDRSIDDVPLGHALLVTDQAAAAPVKVGEA